VRCDLGADFTGEGFGACTDRVGHGTHVAGIVGAVAGNGKGVASLAPGTSILPVRVLDSSGSGGSIAVAKGIVHAVDKGAGVINLSLGGPGGSSALDAAVRYATDRGALVVVSAGNNRQLGNEVNYPAASPGALSVASTDQSGGSSSFSYRGPSVDLAAPGGRIASLWADSDRGYRLASGTSMAAPAVSAVASLYRAAHPGETPAQVTAALLGTATDLETPGRDDATGAGLVNPTALLGASPAPTTPPAAPAPGAPAQQPPPVTSHPAPVVTAPVKVPAPHVRVVAPRVARKQAIALQLADYRPGSSVTVLEVFPVVQRVSAEVDGRTVTRAQTTNRTVVLGSFRVGADGSVSAKVLPVQGVRAGTLVVRGVDRAGKAVQRTAAIRVG
jgi:subtilisin family serine protease